MVADDTEDTSASDDEEADDSPPSVELVDIAAYLNTENSSSGIVNIEHPIVGKEPKWKGYRVKVHEKILKDVFKSSLLIK